MSQASETAHVVQIHGGFVGGSGWLSVYAALRRQGHRVTVVQNPTLSLADDVAVARRAIDAHDGQVILVGHSYGSVATEAGNDPRVVGLVYIAAFAPDKGGAVSSLIQNRAPGAPVPPIVPPQEGFLFLDETKVPGLASPRMSTMKPRPSWRIRRCRRASRRWVAP